VLAGDFLQLPPVVPLAEQDMLARMDYSGPYAFDAKVLERTPVARVAFTTVHRQTDRLFMYMLRPTRARRLLALVQLRLNKPAPRYPAMNAPVPSLGHAQVLSQIGVRILPASD
jgi:ATP-dependent DNA helicase PIF1